MKRNTNMPSMFIRETHHRLSPEYQRLHLVVAALVATACSLGWMIASENWLFVAGVWSALLLVHPIEVALGLYAFLTIYLAAPVEFGILGMLFLFAAVRSHLRVFRDPQKYPHFSPARSLRSGVLVNADSGLER
jgi:hypothetical protein